MFSIHPSIILILGFLLLCGFVYWVIQIRKGIYLHLNTFADSQNNRMRQLEEMIQYSQYQQQQFLQSMAQPVKPVKPMKPVIHKPSAAPEVPIRKPKRSVPPPPPSPNPSEEEESLDELDELLKEELAELVESVDVKSEELEYEEISTDSLKKTTES